MEDHKKKLTIAFIEAVFTIGLREDLNPGFCRRKLPERKSVMGLKHVWTQDTTVILTLFSTTFSLVEMLQVEVRVKTISNRVISEEVQFNCPTITIMDDFKGGSKV